MKVFIIDDEQVSLFIIRHQLVFNGLVKDGNIQSFQSVKEAFTSLTKCSDEAFPNIVLLDLNMPEMDGWEFLDALTPFWIKLKDRCRIYIITSSISSSDEERAKENSMVAGLFLKPISTEDIRLLERAL